MPRLAPSVFDSSPVTPASSLGERAVALLWAARAPIETEALRALLAESGAAPSVRDVEAAIAGDRAVVRRATVAGAPAWKARRRRHGASRVARSRIDEGHAVLAAAARSLDPHDDASPVARYLARFGAEHVREAFGAAAAAVWLGRVARVASLLFSAGYSDLRRVLAVLEGGDSTPEVRALVALVRRHFQRLVFVSSGAARQLVFAHAAFVDPHPVLRAEARAWLARHAPEQLVLLPMRAAAVDTLREGRTCAPSFDGSASRRHLVRASGDRVFALGAPYGVDLLDPSAEWAPLGVCTDAPVTAVAEGHAERLWIGTAEGEILRGPVDSAWTAKRVARLPRAVADLVPMGAGEVLVRDVEGGVWVVGVDRDPQEVAGTVSPAARPQGGASRVDEWTFAAWTDDELTVVDARSHRVESLGLPWPVGWVARDEDGALLVGAAPRCAIAAHALRFEPDGGRPIDLAEGHAVSLGLEGGRVVVFRWTHDDVDDVEVAIVRARDGAVERRAPVSFPLPTSIRRLDEGLVLAGGFLVDLATLRTIGAVGPTCDVVRLSDGTFVRRDPSGAVEQVHASALRGERCVHLAVPGAGFVDAWTTGLARWVDLHTGAERTFELPWAPSGAVTLGRDGVLFVRHDEVSHLARLAVLDLATGRVRETDTIGGTVHGGRRVRGGARLSGIRTHHEGDTRVHASPAIWLVSEDGRVLGARSARPPTLADRFACARVDSLEVAPEAGVLWRSQGGDDEDDDDAWALDESLGFAELTGPEGAPRAMFAGVGRVLAAYADGRVIVDAGAGKGAIPTQLHAGAVPATMLGWGGDVEGEAVVEA